MDWTRQIDAYCERVSAAFWAEPVNALTNLVFIVVGLATLAREGRRARIGLPVMAMLGAIVALGFASLVAQLIGHVWTATTSMLPLAVVLLSFTAHTAFMAIALLLMPSAFAARSVNWPVLWLSANAMVIGVGSFLFHTVAQPWAAAADTGPIVLFILGFFTVTMNRFVGLPWGQAALATVGFLAFFVLTSWGLRVTIGPIVGGSQSYFPAFFALVGVGWWLHRVRGHPGGRALMQGGAVFAVSLFFRAIDEPICEVFPLGTHFMWHLLNGLVFWILLSALVRHGAAQPSPQAPRAQPA